MGWTAAPATTFTKQKLSFPTKNIAEAGYLFVYLSYDNDSNNCCARLKRKRNPGVYFDDLKVTHTKRQFPEIMRTSLSNMQALPREIHRSIVTPMWNQFGREFPNATRAEIMKFAIEMDKRIAPYIGAIGR